MSWISFDITAVSTCLATVEFPGDLRVPDNVLVSLRAAEDRYNELSTVNTTIVMPYSKLTMPQDQDSDTKYRMGRDGYVYCFNMYARHEEPVRISIWR